MDRQCHPIYLTPDQVCELIPGMTKGHLAQLRYKGHGPNFRKPTPKTVLYVRQEVLNWVESTTRSRSTSEECA
jgi:hypothetical protein